MQNLLRKIVIYSFAFLCITATANIDRASADVYVRIPQVGVYIGPGPGYYYPPPYYRGTVPGSSVYGYGYYGYGPGYYRPRYYGPRHYYKNRYYRKKYRRRHRH